MIFYNKNWGKIVFLINFILTIFLVLEVIPINGYYFVGFKIGIPFNLIWFTVTSFSILNYFKIKWVKYLSLVYIFILPMILVISCSKKSEAYIPANYPYEIHLGQSILIGNTYSLVETSFNSSFEKTILWMSQDKANVDKMNDSKNYSIIEARKADVILFKDSVRITYYFNENIFKSKVYKLPNR